MANGDSTVDKALKLVTLEFRVVLKNLKIGLIS
jgi:hypothetical protein